MKKEVYVDFQPIDIDIIGGLVLDDQEVMLL